MKPNPGPLIATPIILPRAFTIALPVAPCPLLPIKSTLGGPHLRTFVLQSGRDGSAGIASAISLIPSAKFASLSNPILSAMVSNVSSIDFVTPFLEEYEVFSGQFCLSPVSYTHLTLPTKA